MEPIRNFLRKGWAMVVLMACTILAYRELDIPGNTRQFIATVNNNCGDFKGVLRRCHVWKDMGFCFKYRRQMQHVCNKTCQYCGQKQWRVIDIKGIWGQLKEPVNTHVASTTVPKQPPVQILGKETTPQVEDAARAIATQLAGEIDHNELSAPPNAVSQLNEARIGVQSAVVPMNSETKGKMSFSLNVSSAKQEQKTHPQYGPTISGKTQVSEKHVKGTNPIVLLMGYGLGKESSQRVHDDLNNATYFPASDGEAKNNVGSHDALIHDKLLALRDNSTSHTEAAQERKSPSSRISTEDNVPESDLKEIAELLDKAASVNGRVQPVAGNQHMHEETNEGNADTNVLQLNLGAQSLESQEMSTLQSKVTYRDGVKNTHSILPISSDDTTNQKAFEQIAMHTLPNTSEANSTSMAENFVKLNRSEGSMPTDSMVVGYKHGNINNPLQMNPSFRSKPHVSEPSGKQVTLTINERPGTGEAVFKVKNSPHATGVSYTTEDHPEGLPSPTYLLQSENEEARAKADEEEAKIRAATSAIKNVIKLFDKGHSYHGHTRLIQEPTQDFPADSKSLDDGRELAAGVDASEYNAEVAQAQNLDRAQASALALSQQNGPYLRPSEASPGSPPPNYAVVSMSDSKDWKILAHTLATQLKHVLNHMEDREKENRYEKEKIQKQMMLMAQQQMTGNGREDDEGPDDDDDDDYDDEMRNRDEMEKRRHSVSSPQERTKVGNTPRNSRLTDQKFYNEKLRRKLNGLQLAHKAVNSLSRLEIRHKSKKQKRRLA